MSNEHNSSTLGLRLAQQAAERLKTAADAGESPLKDVKMEIRCFELIAILQYAGIIALAVVDDDSSEAWTVRQVEGFDKPRYDA